MAVPRVDTEYQKKIKRAREELKKLISEKKFRAADLLRLAYASQFSIANSPDTTPTTTQSDTFKNLQAEIAKIKKENDLTETFPDLYQLAGTVAVEELGGPIIQFVPGRKDSSISPDEGCLPNVEKRPSDLRGVFAKVGISDPKHIVALCGGLNLARSQDPNLKFDNSYFVDLDQKKSSSPAGSNPLLDDEYYSSVHIYATDKEAFIKDYKEAHKKLSDLGLPQSASEKSTSLWNNMVGQKGAGVAVAAVVVLLSVFYLIINKRRARHSSQQFQ